MRLSYEVKGQQRRTHWAEERPRANKVEGEDKPLWFITGSQRQTHTCTQAHRFAWTYVHTQEDFCFKEPPSVLGLYSICSSPYSEHRSL